MDGNYAQVVCDGWVTDDSEELGSGNGCTNFSFEERS